jgi:hypothetical protein
VQVLKEDLAVAAEAGLLRAEQVAPLVQFVAARRVSPLKVIEGDGLSDPMPADPANPLEDSEMPRFVRGFHDILITIGIVIALTGIWGIGSVYAVLPAVIILSEILVKRQRLALPAVVMTIALTIVIAVTNFSVVLGEFQDLDDNLYFFLFTGSFPVLLGLFYWRYKVPLALALTIYSAGAVLVSAVILILSLIFHDPELLQHHTLLGTVLFFAVALSLFVIALSFDLKDPARQTRLSDVAFWLHLVTAPALLYATLSFVYLSRFDGSFWNGDISLAEAFITLVVVALFMTIGLLLDRRAFVTSGLSSLSLAIWVLFDNSHFKVSEAFFYIMVLVGLIVLSIGIGWPHLRRLLFWFLPLSIKTKLPPLR